MKKVEVLPKEKIPYYQYEGSELVHKIKICKYDVVNLIKFFENVSDSEQEYEIMKLFDRIEIKKLNSQFAVSSKACSYSASLRGVLKNPPYSPSSRKLNTSPVGKNKRLIFSEVSLQ